MIISQTAKTYAKGLIQTAQDGSIDFVAIQHDLKTISEILESSPDLNTVLLSPAVTMEQKINIIEDVFRTEISSQVLNFLKLLVEKVRFNEFEQIVRAFQYELDEINGVKKIVVTSAIELDEVYKQRITEKLNTKLNKNIVADWQIDESIIGGLIVQIDDDVIDTSIKNKLENIQKIKGNL